MITLRLPTASLVAAAVLVGAAPGRGGAEPTSYNVISDVRIPMSDGVLLDSDEYIPTTGCPCPTILVQTPYRKSGAGTRWWECIRRSRARLRRTWGSSRRRRHRRRSSRRLTWPMPSARGRQLRSSASLDFVFPPSNGSSSLGAAGGERARDLQDAGRPSLGGRGGRENSVAPHFRRIFVVFRSTFYGSPPR